VNEPIGPAKCPITGLPFFMNIYHPELGMIATYGGPFDSYTIPTADDDDEGCFRSERFDHDFGDWIEGGEPWPIHQVTAHEFVEHYNWRDQRDDWKKQCDFASEGQSAALNALALLKQAQQLLLGARARHEAMEGENMGTRADFYSGKGKTAEWLGSIAWDGNRDGICQQILNCTSDAAFRHAVASFLASRDDGTTPDQGWPWPWEDSGMSDCHYWFFDGRCWEGRGECKRYGEVYVPADEPEPDWSLIEKADQDHADAVEAALYDAWLGGRDRIEFPDMSVKKNVTFGARSGLMIIGATSHSGGGQHGS
jgi:hypothetical protein